MSDYKDCEWEGSICFINVYMYPAIEKDDEELLVFGSLLSFSDSFVLFFICKCLYSYCTEIKEEEKKEKEKKRVFLLFF